MEAVSGNQDVLNYFIFPLLIFLSRIADVTLSTMRIIFITKGKRLLAPFLGIFEVSIWLMAIGFVMSHLNNPVNFIAYALGFATGNYIGINVERKLAMGIVLIRIITAKEAIDLLQKLRQVGLTVTSVHAEGNLGPVKILFSVVKRKEIERVVRLIKEFNPHAFYTIEDVSFVSEMRLPTLEQERKLWSFWALKKK